MPQKEEKTYGSEMGTLARWRLYAEMTSLGEIARRYFVMNFFDGVLTVLGLVMGSFILYLDGQPPNKLAVIAPAIATAVAIGISGISGGYLSERAERKRNIIEMHKAMAEHKGASLSSSDSSHFKEENYYPINPIKKFEDAELKKPETVHVSVDPESPPTKIIGGKIKRENTLAEKAERYASWIASLINGVSPAIGGLAVIIPFFFDQPQVSDDWIVYMISFIFIAVVIIRIGRLSCKNFERFHSEVWN